MTNLTRTALLGAGALLAAAIVATTASGQTVGDSATAGQVRQQANADSGAEVYRKVCQACHMPDGRGGEGAAKFPALANNPRLAAAGYPVMMVVRGKGGMPSFSDLLTPEQIAGVVGYVRTHFGNSYAEPVSVEQVKTLSRGAPGSHE